MPKKNNRLIVGMQIHLVETHNVNNNYTNKKPYKKIAFNGALTRLAQKSPLISPDFLEAANKVYKRDNGIVGFFPNDFVKAIKTNLGKECHTDRIKDSIKGAEKTFAEISEVLRQIDDQKQLNLSEYTKRLDANLYFENLKQRLDLMTCNDKQKLLELDNKFKTQFLPQEQFIKEIENNASEILTINFKKNNIIPQDAKITVQRLNEGKFGTGYYIKFSDKNGKRLFKDKVIKYYKDEQDQRTSRLDLALKQFEIVKENYNELNLFVKNYFKSIKGQDSLKLKNIKYKLLNELKNYNNLTKEEYKDLLINELKTASEEIAKQHGLLKEANIGNYLNKSIGNDLQKSDLIKYYYTDLNNKYALLEFSSFDNLGPVTKKINYDETGIIPKDLGKLSGVYNLVADRLIDLGGFNITNKIIAENPVARKMYKKIKHLNGKNLELVTNARIKRFNELYAKAIQNRLAQSSDALLGLKETLKLIPKNKHNELLYKSIYDK